MVSVKEDDGRRGWVRICMALQLLPLVLSFLGFYPHEEDNENPFEGRFVQVKNGAPRGLFLASCLRGKGARFLVFCG